MVRSSDRFSPRGFLTAEFPPDRAAPPAWLTVPLARVYAWAARRHHARWKSARAFRSPVPVISIGNLTVGGTGKTPCVMALARLLMDMEPSLCAPHAITVLSRGYGRRSRDLIVVESDHSWQQCGDEPLLIKRALPNIAVVVHADRTAAAHHAVEKLGSRLLLLDDGFQHRHLARDLDLVLLDASAPLGNGYCLPAGPLREPPEALRRASLLISVGNGKKTGCLALHVNKPCLTASIQLQLPPMKARSVFVLTSIARPSRFINSLIERGLTIRGTACFRDHHPFTSRELEQVAEHANSSEAEAIITTAKDQTRFPAWTPSLPLYVADSILLFADPSELRKPLEPLVFPAVKSTSS
jgi:tetraacyldisaccharide 4'-kinase